MWMPAPFPGYKQGSECSDTLRIAVSLGQSGDDFNKNLCTEQDYTEQGLVIQSETCKIAV